MRIKFEVCVVRAGGERGREFRLCGQSNFHLITQIKFFNLKITLIKRAFSIIIIWVISIKIKSHKRKIPSPVNIL